MLDRDDSGQSVKKGDGEAAMRSHAIPARAILSTDVLYKLDTTQKGGKLSDAEIAWTWIERKDAQNFVVLGDPAVRLRLDQPR